MADLAITAANVAKELTTDPTQVENGTAGATITAGQTVYLDPTDGKYKLADANGVSPLYVFRGIALNNASNLQPLQVATGGRLTIGATVAAGSIYILSANAGGIGVAADLASGHYTNVVAIGVSTTQVKIFSGVTAGVAVP